MSISSRRIHRTGDQRLLRERFEYNPGAWTEAASAADNRYDVIWTGSGIVQITPQKTLQLESTVNPSANGWGDTASSLVVGRNTVGDFDETVRMRTIAQLRNEAVPAGSRGSPNPWEVAWFGWHFVRSGIDNAFYYVALKPNGFELGKVDQRLRKQDGGFILNGGQRFMYTDAVPYPIGTWHKLRIKQLGANIEVWVDDIHKTSFTDIPGSTNWNTAESALLSGRWVYYHEDARVEFDDAPRIPSGSLPPPNDDPVNLTITTSVSYITLSWTAPISPYGQVQGYNIYVNGVKNNGAPEPNRGYTLTRLAASTMYQIKITTVVDGKESLGVLRSVTTNAGSTAPLVTVSTVSQLHDALAGTSAGQTIQISDGNYNGNFVLRNKHGTLEQPIIIQGTKNAIIHGGVTTGGYALYLDNCTYVQLKGFQITGAQKSLMCEQVCNSTIDSLTTHDCGAESIALRNLSSDNIVKNCEVYNTGLVSPQYGEGIYIGMYYGDWSSSKSRTGGMPDASDRNQILSNNIHDTGAECIDIKEGTSNGVIRGNTLEGKYMSGQNYADSWIDIAGCGYTVENNTGTDALLDGIQTHTQPGGIKTASDNIFRSNVLNVNATGYGISIDTAGSGNVVYASNSVTGSAKGLTNITITP